MLNSLKFLITLIIINVFWGLVRNNSIKSKKSMANIVQMPKWTLWLSIVGSVMMFLAMYGSSDDLKYFIYFLIMELIGVFILLSYINCKIYYNENSFIYKNFIGKKYEYTYDQIIKYDFDNENIYITTINKKIKISFIISEGSIEFIKFIQKQKKDKK